MQQVLVSANEAIRRPFCQHNDRYIARYTSPAKATRTKRLRRMLSARDCVKRLVYVAYYAVDFRR